ncbi:MAG: lipid-binding SYLF domain-containing protein [Pseudomonadota bacterium]
MRMFAAAAATVLTMTCSTVLAEPEPATLVQHTAAEIAPFFDGPRWEGTRNMLGGAKAVLLAPDVSSGAFIVGFDKGSGLLLVRHGDKWSDPVFVKLEQASVGFQFGASESELMMLVMTRSAVDDLVDGVSRIGGTGGFALGTLGIGGGGGGGLEGGLQLFSVSSSEGLGFGSALGNLQIAPLPDANATAYGADFSMSDVLGQAGGSYPEAAPLLSLLENAVQAAWYE